MTQKWAALTTNSQVRHVLPRGIVGVATVKPAQTAVRKDSRVPEDSPLYREMLPVLSDDFLCPKRALESQRAARTVALPSG